MRKANRLPLDQLAPYLLNLPDPLARLHWSDVFGNDHPVELEIGFGKGSFLLASALARPDTNFLGIEIDRKYQLYTANRIAKRALRNVRLMKADAKQVLPLLVADGSLHALHVYFPDPWWKKRHHKRRLFTPDFLDQCDRILSPIGRLHIATDVPDYFALILELLASRSAFVQMPADHAPIVTNFERKAHEQDRLICRAVFARNRESTESPMTKLNDQ